MGLNVKLPEKDTDRKFTKWKDQIIFRKRVNCHLQISFTTFPPTFHHDGPENRIVEFMGISGFSMA